MVTETGILALWKDCAPGKEALFEHWYRSEHLAERVAVPGFRRGRRYEAIEAKRRYFTYYETDAPEILVSDAYLQRLDDPTPLTREIMSGVMRSMSRTICRQDWRIGEARGSHALTAALKADGVAAATSMGESLMALSGVARVEIWVAADDIAIPMSDEERMRGGDERIAACLFAETLRESELDTLAQEVGKQLAPNVEWLGLYRLLCDLER